MYNHVVRATIESDNLESFLKSAVSLDNENRLFKGDRVICSGQSQYGRAYLIGRI